MRFVNQCAMMCVRIAMAHLGSDTWKYLVDRWTFCSLRAAGCKRFRVATASVVDHCNWCRGHSVHALAHLFNQT
jgi:hypothetical protein